MKPISILTTIKERRSIHTFKEDIVDSEILKDIFSYGTYAPTHYMKEPWNIKLYQEDGKTKLIDAIMASYERIGMIKDSENPKSVKMIQSMRTFLGKIPHHAVIYFPIEDDPVRYEEEYAAVCAFIQNVQLVAWEFGVGVLWTITPYMHDPGFLHDIDLDPDMVKVAAVLQMGYPAKIPHNKGRTSIEEKLEIIKE
ncbi:nitroreductase family protein [Oceanobacillus halotolerans]|uniref:nitroreductase family protein n=1 Tax=Oceanobacillus halotolerans TaxID=2663380 RepID=UPI001CF78A7D|nr:nitroreductase [Oceanobacillus halotolerans]